MDILLRELCRLHSVSLPNDLENLSLPLQLVPESLVNLCHHNEHTEDSDPDEIEDVIGDSEPESEADEDLPLEMDDARSANKVSFLCFIIFIAKTSKLNVF